MVWFDNKVDDVGTSQQTNNSTNSAGNEFNENSIPMRDQLQQQQMNNNVVFLQQQQQQHQQQQQQPQQHVSVQKLKTI
jgi:hypothetical protein